MTTSRTGFTLIELLIALGLAMLVGLAAFTAFATTSKAVTKANRIALQNRLLVNGTMYAMEDLDAWRSYNSLNAPRSGTLHTTPDPDRPGTARPFNDFTFHHQGVRIPLEDLAFRADDSKWWYRSVYVPRGGSAQPDYTLLGHRGGAGEGAFLHDLGHALMTQLGNYATLDYWPPGVPLGVTDATGKKAGYLTSTGSGLASGGENIWPPSARIGGDEGQWAVLIANHPHDLDYNRRTIRSDFNEVILSDLPLADRQVRYDQHLPRGTAGPADWPMLQTIQRHLIQRNLFIHQSSVKMHDYDTGETMLVAFSAPCTSLRGARRMRGLDQ